MFSFTYFFSYSRQNTAFVARLAADLKAAAIEVWFDQTHIAPGTRWDDSIQTALQTAKGLLVILSPASVQSQNVMDEVSYAIDLGKQIVPLMIERCEVPFRLARYQYIDFTGAYEPALQRLLVALQNNPTTIPQPPGPDSIKQHNKPDPDKTIRRTGSKKWIGIAVVGLLLATIFIIIKWSNGKTSPGDAPISTTVFVHGKGGRQDMILRQKGFVTMDLGAERKRSSINENGQAFFQNLHIGDSVRLEIDFVQPYRTIHPDSVYIIQPNSSIYLPVALQGIDQLRGIVLYNDAPLSGVMVKLVSKKGELLDTTGATGDYSFNIPETLQADEYQVWFIRNHFKTISAPAYPQNGQPLNIVMEKSK